jgi:hypothetical protein
VTTQERMAELTAKKQDARRDVSWCQFLDLKPPKAVSWNVYYASEGEGHFSRATIRFLKRHGINRVYAPGANPT